MGVSNELLWLGTKINSHNAKMKLKKKELKISVAGRIQMKQFEYWWVSWTRLKCDRKSILWMTKGTEVVSCSIGVTGHLEHKTQALYLGYRLHPVGQTSATVYPLNMLQQCILWDRVSSATMYPLNLLKQCILCNSICWAVRAMNTHWKCKADEQKYI